MCRSTDINQPVKLQFKLPDGRTNRFVRCFVIAPDDSTFATVDLTHTDRGRYVGTVTPNLLGDWTLEFVVYRNSGYTNVHGGYSQRIIELRVENSATTGVSEILNRLTAARAANLDNLDVAISTREAEAAAATRDNASNTNQAAILAAINALNNLDSASVITALDSQGFSSSRAALLDNLANLDVAVSTRLSDADAATLFANIATGISAVITGIAGLNNLSITEVESALTAAGLGSGSAALLANLANLDVAVSTRESETSAAGRETAFQNLIAGVLTAIGNLHNISNLDIQTALTDQGYTTARAGKLDFLDVAVGTRESEANALARFQGRATDEDQTQAAIAGLNDISVADIINGLTSYGLTTTRIGNLDNLDVQVSSLQTETDAADRYNVLVSEINDLEASLGGVGTNALTIADVTGVFNSLGWNSTRSAKLDNLDATVSSRESEASSSARSQANDLKHQNTIAAIQNLNNIGSSDIVTIMNNQGYTVTRANKIDRLDVAVSTLESEVDAHNRHVANLQEFQSVITGIGNLNNLSEAEVLAIMATLGYTAARANLLDNLDVAVSSRESEVNGLQRSTVNIQNQAGILAAINGLANISVNDVQIALNNQGLTQARAGLLDNLDAQVSNLQTSADAQQAASDLLQEHADTQSILVQLVNGNPDASQIADAVWSEVLADHSSVVGSAARALDLASGGASGLTADGIATALWDRNSNSHTIANSFGERIANLKNLSDQNIALIQVLNGKLTAQRASALDNLDVTISSRLSMADYNAGVSILQGQNNQIESRVVNIQGQLSPLLEIASIKGILEDPAIGLQALCNKQQLSATDAKQDQILTAIGTLSSPDLTPVLNSVTNIQTLINDPTSGLAAIKTEVDSKASQASVDNLESSDDIAAKVWDAGTATMTSAGSIGKLLRDNVDVRVSSRLDAASFATTAGIVQSILAALNDASSGLAALKVDLGSNGTKLDGLATGQTSLSSQLNQARSDILTSVTSIQNGTPQILAELAQIKGNNFAAGDDLHSIRAALGQGSATAANQTAIINSLAALDTKADDIKADVGSVDTKVLQNRTQIIAEVDANEAKIDQQTVKIDSLVSGQAQAVTDRGTKTQEIKDAIADNLVEIGAAKTLATDNGNAISNLLTELQASTSAIQTDITNIGPVGTSLNQIINLLSNASFGLSALKDLIDALDADIDTTALEAIVTANGVKLNEVKATLEEIKGPGFTQAAHSLVEIAIGSSLDLSALGSLANQQSILDMLTTIKGVGFATSDDSLAEISERSLALAGVSGFGA